MNISLYAHEPGPVSRAFLKVFNFTEHSLIEVFDQKSADLVILDNSSNLRAVYNCRQLFCVLDVPGQRKLAESQPANVCLIDIFRLFDSEGKGITYLLRVLEEHMVNKATKPANEPLPEFKNVVGLKKNLFGTGHR